METELHSTTAMGAHGQQPHLQIQFQFYPHCLSGPSHWELETMHYRSRIQPFLYKKRSSHGGPLLSFPPEASTPRPCPPPPPRSQPSGSPCRS